MYIAISKNREGKLFWLTGIYPTREACYDAIARAVTSGMIASGLHIGLWELAASGPEWISQMVIEWEGDPQGLGATPRQYTYHLAPVNEAPRTVPGWSGPGGTRSLGVIDPEMEG